MKRLSAFIVCFLMLASLAVAQIGPYKTATLTAASASCLATNCVDYKFSTGNTSTTAIVQVENSFSGTLQFEAKTYATGTVTSITGYPIAIDTGVTSATAAGTWRFSIAGLSDLIVRASTLSSGTPKVTIVTVPSPFNIGGSQAVAASTGGCTPYSFVSTASANLTNVTSTATTLCSVTAINPGSTLQYLRLYNKASAPDPSACSSNSDCAVIYTPIPADFGSLGAGYSIPLGSAGMAFSAGLGFSISGAACTVVATCTDETNAAAGVTLILGYK